MAAHHTWDKINSLLDVCRQEGVLVVYVKVALRPGHPELSEKSYPIHAGGRDVGAWTEGTWGAEIVDELKPKKQDIVITNYSPNVFLFTNLDQILRAKGITDLLLTGTATNFVVEEAGRYGAQIGYDITTVEDCCVSFNDRDACVLDKEYPPPVRCRFEHQGRHRGTHRLVGGESSPERWGYHRRPWENPGTGAGEGKEKTGVHGKSRWKE